MFLHRLIGLTIITMMLAGSFISIMTPVSSEPVSSRASSRAITKGPWLQNVTNGSITVMWASDVAGTSVVDYGTDITYGNQSTGASGVWIHEVLLTNLLENTTYHYQVSTDGAFSPDSTFKTAVAKSETYTFAILGDTRTDHVAHQAVNWRLESYSPEFLFNTGDLVASGGVQADWDAFFQDIDVLDDHIPYMPVIGNHDLPPTNYMNYFSLPNNERYYTYNYSSTHFIVLDTNLPYTTGSAQYNWLEDDLKIANGTADWVFVLFHHPAYSSSSYGSTANVQTYLVPLFEKYGVNAVFNGHDHDYEHALVNGVHYFVAGGGGAPVYANGTSSWTVYSESVHSFVYLSVSDTKVNLKAIRKDGTLMEEVNLTNADVKPPGAVPLTATDAGLGDTIDLDWSTYDEQGQGDVAGYRIYYSTSNFTDVDPMPVQQTFPPGTFSTQVNGLPIETEHFFAVTAVDEVPNERKTVVAVPATPTDKVQPLSPTGISVTAVNYSTLNLSWDANIEPDLDGYEMFMNRSGAGPGGPYDPIATVNATTTALQVIDLAQNTTYCFVLQAFDNATTPNNSTFSTEVCVDTLLMPVNSPPESREYIFLEFLEDAGPINDRKAPLDMIFSDPDDDVLQFQIIWSEIPTVLGTGDLGEPIVIYNLEENWTGTGFSNVSATDGEFTVYANISVTVLPVNDAPVINVSERWNLLEDVKYTFTIDMFDAEDPIEFLTISTDLTKVIPGAVRSGNVWIGLQNISFQPDDTMVGEWDINITVTDPEMASDTAQVHVIIGNVNDVPIIIDISPLGGSRFGNSTTIEFKVIADDPDIKFDDRLSYEWSTNVTGSFGYGDEVGYTFPVGIYNVTVTVTDLKGATANMSVVITVYDDTPIPPPPPPPPIPPPPDPPIVDPFPWFAGMLLIPCIMIIVILMIVIVIVILFMRSSSRPPPPSAMPPPMYQPRHMPLHGPPVGPPPPGYGPPPYVVPNGLPSEPDGAAQTTTPEVADGWEVVEVMEEEEGPKKEEDLDEIISKLKDEGEGDH